MSKGRKKKVTFQPEETCIPISEPTEEAYHSKSEQKRIEALMGSAAEAAEDLVSVVEETEVTAEANVLEDPPVLDALLRCDCDAKVGLSGTPGKDYFVLSIMSNSLQKDWYLHNRKDCFKDVSKKIAVAHKSD